MISKATHRSKWTWGVDEIWAYDAKLRSTHCREFLFNPLTSLGLLDLGEYGNMSVYSG